MVNMFVLFILVLPLVFAASTRLKQNDCVDVNIADFPWQGSYRTATGSHVCGCVFVGGVWVLTAAHCGGTGAYSMTFGSSTIGGGIAYSLASVTRHPNYDVGPGFTPNDIAVVQATSIISGTNISPGSIPVGSDNPGGDGWSTGWLRTCGSPVPPTSLTGMVIPIISDSECTAIMGSSFQSSNMLCTNAPTPGCVSESGGPLSVGETIYGIMSWSLADCEANYPHVYCKVGAFRNWVCAITNNEAYGC